ncbi:MAG: hypothetical protein HZC29_03660 [Thaumarchaeota archaeon]|nr:hypothetical protein [Nitrososphaerota archaeon]
MRYINPSWERSFGSVSLWDVLHEYAEQYGYNVEDAFLHYTEDTTYGAPGTYQALLGPHADFYFPVYISSGGSFINVPATQNTTLSNTVGEGLYIGSVWDRFKELTFNLTTGRGGSWQGIWEYWNGTNWVSLMSFINLDETSGLQTSGKLEFNPPPTKQQWKPSYINGYFRWWIRLRTTVSGTPPIIQGKSSIIPQTIYRTDAQGRYIIPGWDSANDVNGDGIWDTNSNPNATATFPSHARIPGRNQVRWMSGKANVKSALYKNAFVEFALRSVEIADVNGKQFEGLHIDSYSRKTLT